MIAIPNNLILGNSYDREAVHDLFEPDTQFTPQAGSWGLHGIVKIKPHHASGSRKSYVFFVTYGKSQGEHHFEEGITSDGVLTWQSQPRQDLQNPAIKDFISHNPEHDSIYLFLRAGDRFPYHYLGRLGYLSHDPGREKPVYFQWQLLDWGDDLSSIVDQILPGKSSKGGYKIPPPNPSVLKQPDRVRKFPIIDHSFTWHSETVMVKELDKSAFLHHGTAIPKEMIDYWIGTRGNDRNQPLDLIYFDTKYSAHIENDDHGRFRLLWNSNFEEVLQTRFPRAYQSSSQDLLLSGKPQIRFEKLGKNTFTIEFIDEEKINQDNDLISSGEQPEYQDGRVVTYSGTRYERDPRNRRLAIKHHGTTCAACGFNFGKFYGSIGEGFIEIHHVNPLYQNGTETTIDPETDLVPLCPNCHRMIHRDLTKVLTIDGLKKLIKK